MNSFRPIFPLILLLLLSYTTCKQGRSNGMETAELIIPELLPRIGAVGSNEEMEMIADAYERSRAKLEKDPQNATAKLKLVEVLITEGRVSGQEHYYADAAIPLTDHVLLGKPSEDQRFQALMMKGTLLLTLHRFSEALTVGEQAMQINGHNAGAYGVLIDAHVELGNYERAVELADKMVSIRPDLRSYSRIAYLRELHGQVEGAMEAMDMAVKAGFPGQDQTEWCRIQLGKLYEQTGDLESAEQLYREAIHLRPNYPNALAALGNLERKKGNLTESEQILKQAVAYQHHAALEGLALTYQHMNDQDKYASTVNKSVEALKGSVHGPGHGSGRHGDDDHHHHGVGLEMAKLHLQFTDEIDEAIHHAQHELEERPKNIEVHEVLAAAYYLSDDMKKASNHLDKALATGREGGFQLCLSGLIHHANGETDRGRQLLQQAFALDPFQEHVLAEQARILLQGG